ncbi:MAG: GIY-YIG nuclease family protein [Bacteroidetes bacterium]|nr:MAG: GIY-YIG nuclease family protein [Bacteroidota bacterium]
MKQYVVYILRCADNSYYIGFTTDVERRLAEHQNGKYERGYTFSRRPVRLLYFEYYATKLQATLREKQLKGWSRAKKQALIAESYERLERLSKNYTQFLKL